MYVGQRWCNVMGENGLYKGMSFRDLGHAGTPLVEDQYWNDLGNMVPFTCTIQGFGMNSKFYKKKRNLTSPNQNHYSKLLRLKVYLLLQFLT